MCTAVACNNTRCLLGQWFPSWGLPHDQALLLSCCCTARDHTVRCVSRRQACFGGDDDDYDHEAGGKEESEHKYRKVSAHLLAESQLHVVAELCKPHSS